MASRDDVIFPEGVDRLDVTNKYLLYCPHSFMHHHIRTGRGIELLEDKLRYLTLEVERPGRGGAAGSKRKGTTGGAGCDYRDLHECRNTQLYINDIIYDLQVPTAVVVDRLKPMLR